LIPWPVLTGTRLKLLVVVFNDRVAHLTIDCLHSVAEEAKIDELLDPKKQTQAGGITTSSISSAAAPRLGARTMTVLRRCR
jgi:hypothetical protein